MAGEDVPGQRDHRVFDPQRCRHFAECLRGLPEVFNARNRPWIAPDAASAALVAEVIRRCPSGALHYQAPGVPGEQPEVPATIRAVDRGPFLVRGDLRIYAADGPVTDTRAALCRCTRSARQPFCDAALRGPRTAGPARSTGTVIPQDTPSALGRREATGGHPRRWVPVQPPVWPGRCCSGRRALRGPAGAVHRRSAADLGIRCGRGRSGASGDRVRTARPRRPRLVREQPQRMPGAACRCTWSLADPGGYAKVRAGIGGVSGDRPEQDPDLRARLRRR